MKTMSLPLLPAAASFSRAPPLPLLLLALLLFLLCKTNLLTLLEEGADAGCGENAVHGLPVVSHCHCRKLKSLSGEFGAVHCLVEDFDGEQQRLLHRAALFVVGLENRLCRLAVATAASCLPT